MVLIGGVKYACERCIRGHRVTTCNHTDQPLIMIKPKGRPSSQCKHCKALRIDKNAHSSGSCTCGKNNGHSVNGIKKKKCGCDSGKNCECHKRRGTPGSGSGATRSSSTGSSKENSVTNPLPKQQSISPPSNINYNNTSSSTSKRVGEVSIPINEFIPNNSSEIGNVLNDSAVAGFFQDVPLPFEPGHGLLDLFEPSSSSVSTQSHLTSSHYSSFPVKTPMTKTSSINSSTNTATSLNSTGYQNVSSLNSSKKGDFDVFHNLVLTPNTSAGSPQNMPNMPKQFSLFGPNNSNNNNNSLIRKDSIPDNISEHSSNSFQSSIHTLQSNSIGFNGSSNNYNYNDLTNPSSSNTNITSSNQQSSGLFGNYQPYQNREANDSTVEVLSLTPSFNDIIPGYDAYDEKKNDEVLKNTKINNSNNNNNQKKSVNGIRNNNDVTNGVDTNNGFLNRKQYIGTGAVISPINSNDISNGLK